MAQAATAERPEAKATTYLYLVAYMHSGKSGKPVVIEPGVPYVSMLRQFFPSPFRVDSEETVKALEEALTIKNKRPCMIVALSPLF